MQCLTQLASPVHLPGYSRGSSLDFYPSRQASSGTDTLFSSVTSAVLYTNYDMMHLCLSHH